MRGVDIYCADAKRDKKTFDCVAFLIKISTNNNASQRSLSCPRYPNRWDRWVSIFRTQLFIALNRNVPWMLFSPGHAVLENNGRSSSVDGDELITARCSLMRTSLRAIMMTWIKALVCRWSGYSLDRIENAFYLRHRSIWNGSSPFLASEWDRVRSPADQIKRSTYHLVQLTRMISIFCRQAGWHQLSCSHVKLHSNCVVQMTASEHCRSSCSAKIVQLYTVHWKSSYWARSELPSRCKI